MSCSKLSMNNRYIAIIQYWPGVSVISAGTFPRTVPMSIIIVRPQSQIVLLALQHCQRMHSIFLGRPVSAAVGRLQWLPLWQRFHCVYCRNVVRGSPLWRTCSVVTSVMMKSTFLVGQQVAYLLPNISWQ